MSPHQYPLHSPPKAQRIERAFFRLHQLLCLIERRAAQADIERAERSYHRSLKNLEVSERELVRHYPRYRFAMLARAAAESAGIPSAAGLPPEQLN